MARIDAVAWAGFAFIEWWELTAWYEAERISKRIWRDLRARFSELTEGENVELMTCEHKNGVLLVRSDKLKSISDRIGECE